MTDREDREADGLRHARVAERIRRRLASHFPDGAPPFAIRFPDSSVSMFGDGPPRVALVANDRRGERALERLDATLVAEAYRDGAVDVEGDLQSALALRELFSDRHPITWAWRFIRPRLFGQVASDRAWISEHYDHSADFYLLFLDRQHRCYSQAVFDREDEPLECAQARKLAFALDAVGARPGDRVLDIGGGWGAFVEYAGQRGVHVTSLTISSASEQFIRALIARQQLPCQVVREHLFAHRPGERYHAIVNLGVTEHLPDYPATLAKYRELLVPGGRIYLDASAAPRRHHLSAFFLRYVFPGNGTLMCLHDYLAAVSRTPFELLAVYNDRLNYARTCRYWAQNLDQHAAEIVARWGEPLYRTFRLYLWGCVDGFERDMIQAYRVVMRLPDTV